MVTRFGMSPEIGLVALDRTEDGNYLDSGFGGGAGRAYSEATAREVDQAIRRIVDEAYTKALDLLTRERWRLDGLTEALLREESLGEAQIRAAAGLEDRPVATNEVALNR
jgi:cell division protease FtsH